MSDSPDNTWAETLAATAKAFWAFYGLIFAASLLVVTPEDSAKMRDAVKQLDPVSDVHVSMTELTSSFERLAQRSQDGAAASIRTAIENSKPSTAREAYSRSGLLMAPHEHRGRRFLMSAALDEKDLPRGDMTISRLRRTLRAWDEPVEYCYVGAPDEAYLARVESLARRFMNTRTTRSVESNSVFVEHFLSYATWVDPLCAGEVCRIYTEIGGVQLPTTVKVTCRPTVRSLRQVYEVDFPGRIPPLDKVGPVANRILDKTPEAAIVRLEELLEAERLEIDAFGLTVPAEVTAQFMPALLTGAAVFMLAHLLALRGVAGRARPDTSTILLMDNPAAATLRWTLLAGGCVILLSLAKEFADVHAAEGGRAGNQARYLIWVAFAIQVFAMGAGHAVLHGLSRANARPAETTS